MSGSVSQLLQDTDNSGSHISEAIYRGERLTALLDTARKRTDQTLVAMRQVASVSSSFMSDHGTPAHAGITIDFRLDVTEHAARGCSSTRSTAKQTTQARDIFIPHPRQQHCDPRILPYQLSNFSTLSNLRVPLINKNNAWLKTANLIVVKISIGHNNDLVADHSESRCSTVKSHSA